MRTKFVGRAAEIADLQRELGQASTEGFRCVLLLGDPGVGKTRLGREVVERTRRRAIAVSARAHPLGETAAFALWIEALERHLRTLGAPEVVRLCGGFLDDLAGLLRSVAAACGSAPDHEPPRPRLLEGLTVLLRNLALERPLVVVLDDVHLADASSWEALHYLARNLPIAHILVICSARSAELTQCDVGMRVVLDLEQEGLLRRATLQPLQPDAIGELARMALGSHPPEELVGWLVDRSQGNPLFALGLLQALLDERADLSNPTLGAVPDSLAGRVRVRLSSLAQEAVQTLELLTVLGGRVELDELAVVSEQPLELLGSILDGLAASRLVVADVGGPRPSYEVAHPLIEEAVYEGIGPVRRADLHRRVGRALLEAARPGSAALHFSRSASVGDAEAIEALCQAVRQAESRQTYREALAILGALVELLPSGDERWLQVFDAMLWDAEWVVDHRADAHALLGIRALREIDALLATSSDAGRRAMAKFRLASFLSSGQGDLEEAERFCTEALRLFEEAGDRRRQVLAALELAMIQGMRGDLLGPLAHAGEAIEAAESTGDRFLQLQVALLLGYGALYLGRFEDAEAVLRKSTRIAREDQRSYRLSWGLSTLAWTLAMEGRLEEAVALLEEARAVTPTFRDGPLLEYETIVSWLRGDHRMAMATADEAMAWNPTGMSKRRGIGLAFAALSATETGQTAKARQYLAAARETYGDRDWLFYRDYVTYGQAMLAWQSGRGPEALPALYAVASKLLDMGVAPFAGLVLVDVCQLAGEVGEPDLAAEAATQLEDVARRTGRDLYRALASLGGAWAMLAAGEADRAADAAREASKILGELGCQAFLGRALDVLGRSLVRSDRSEAANALEAAAAVFGVCGAGWRRAQTLGALRDLGKRGRKAHAAVLGPTALTRREREAARLAADGRSNREIADRLFISERTVEWHLANAYAKLGVASKLELTRSASDLLP